jgi:hypothetical protein
MRDYIHKDVWVLGVVDGLAPNCADKETADLASRKEKERISRTLSGENESFAGMRDYIHKDVWVNNGTGGTDVSQKTAFLLRVGGRGNPVQTHSRTAPA